MSFEFSNLRVWLVHDWLTGWRGGEKILLELVRMFPHARIATLVHVPGSTHPELDARVAQTSFLQRLPGGRRHYRYYLPLFPRAVGSLKLDGACDLVLSVSHAVAKGVVPPENGGGGVPHICYCNTPMRYIWGLEGQYLSRCSPKRWALQAATPALRRFDLDNRHVSLFVSNSQNIARRIQRCYQRDALVVYAGIDHDYFTPATEKARAAFYLCAGALVGYKRIDLALRAFASSPRRLVIIGTGPEERRLRRVAGRAPNITFLGRQPDDVLRDHYQRCRAFVFPGEEDFGLTPVEAQACGTPVIAYGAGGVLESVLQDAAHPTGVFFPEQTAASLGAAIERFEHTADAFQSADFRASALRFTWEGFREGIAQAIRQVLERPAHPPLPTA